jgi:hypothetical protein
MKNYHTVNVKKIVAYPSVFFLADVAVPGNEFNPEFPE